MGNWRFGAFPKLPYSTMQQLNLDWILDRIRRFLPDNGTKGQVLTRTKDGAAWQDVSAVAGSVNSVNGKTGDVVLTASDVGALPSSYQAPVTSVNGMTGDVVISSGGAVDSVNGQTGDVVLTAADVGALPSSTVIPDSTSDLTNDSGFITVAQAAAAAPVQSVNGQTGAAVIDAEDVGALPDTLPHITEIGTATGGWSWVLYSDNSVDLYWFAMMTISNYSAIESSGLYLFGPVDLPFTIETGYAFLAGGKVGNGTASIVLCNPLSGSKISIVAQSNLTGVQDCSVSAHLHGKKAV